MSAVTRRLGLPGLPLHMILVDFKGAYDNISRFKLIKALQELKIPSRLTRLINMTLQDTKCAIKVNGQTSSEFIVKKGARQGDTIQFSAQKGNKGQQYKQGRNDI